MFKKIFSFFILLFLLSSQTFALDYDEYPYSYRTFFPQEDAIVGIKKTSTVKNAFSTGNSGENSYLFNTLAIHSPKVTPGYNSQIYNIFPDNYNGIFGDITLHIRNFEYPYSMMDKLRPVITIEYRDENNSPIYTSYNGFNPLEYSTFGMGNVTDSTISVNSLPQDGNWHKTGVGYMHSNGTWAMDIKLPMDKLSNRENYTDEDSGLSLAPLKYIKVKFSLVSLEQSDGSSFLECQMIKPNSLIGTDGVTKLDYFGGEIGESKHSLYFNNGSKFQIVSPVTLGENFYGSGAQSFSSRELFKTAVEQEIDYKNTLNNTNMKEGNFDSDYFFTDIGFYNQSYTYTNTAGQERTLLGKDIISSEFYNDGVNYKLFFNKGNFAIEDCMQLSIKKETTSAGKASGYRLENLLKTPGNQQTIENSNYNDGVDCTILDDTAVLGCGDNNPSNDSVMYKAYSDGAGFGFEPKNFNESGYFSTKASIFQYNIGISGTTPDISAYFPGAPEEELNKMTPPKLMGSYGTYDWKNEAPLISKESYSSNLNTENKEKIMEEANQYCKDNANGFTGDISSTLIYDKNNNGIISLKEKYGICLAYHGLIVVGGNITDENINDGEVGIIPNGKIIKFDEKIYGTNGTNKILIGDGEGAYLEDYNLFYKEVLDITSPILNDNYGNAKDLVTNEAGKNSSNDTFNSIETIFDTLTANQIGQYIQTDKFFSSIPYNIRNSISTENFIRAQYDRILKENKPNTASNDGKFVNGKKIEDRDTFYQVSLTEDWYGKMIDKSSTDESFQWQTLYPWDDDRDHTYPEGEGNAGTTVIGYNMSLLKGTKYLKLGTYDLDNDKNGGNPNTATTISIRPTFIDTTETLSSSEYSKHGPILIKIDGTFKNSNDSMRQRAQIGMIPLYYFNAENIGGAIDESSNGYGSKIQIADQYDGDNYKDTYLIPGPEGNNNTTFYKFSLKKLYDMVCDYDASTKTCNAKDGSGWTDKDAKTMNDWQFNPDGSLKETIYLRMVINNPDLNKFGGYSPNVIYLYSNGTIGSIPKQLSDGKMISSNLELIKSNKSIMGGVNGADTPYTYYGTGFLQPRPNSEILDEHILLSTYRLQSDDLYNNDIINPYLLKPTLIDLDENLESIDFTSDEINEIKKIEILDGENGTEKSLGLGTKISDTIYQYNGNDYNKVCLSPENVGTFIPLPDKQGNTIDNLIPYQIVCYYIKDSAGLSETDLLNDSNLRILSLNNDNYLPFVDITIKQVVKENSNLSTIPYSVYNYNILNSTNTSIEVNAKDENGVYIKKLKDLPSQFNLAVLEKNKNDKLVKENRSKLSNLFTFDRFNLVDFTSMEDSLDENTKKLRANNPLFVYFEQAKNGNLTFTYSDFDEDKKINNFTSNVKYSIGDGTYIPGGEIKVTWDYDKIKDENGDSIKPNPTDGNPDDPTEEKNIGDPVIVYPKIENTSGKEICDLNVSFNTINDITSINNGDNQLITDINTPYANNVTLFSSGQTIWVDGDITRDLNSLKDFKYRYSLDGINNTFAYKVNYKFCGEETDPFKETISSPLSFNINGTTTSGGGLCHLNDTEPAEGTNLFRGGDINYKITCTNNTGQDIYNLKIKLPLPEYLSYKEGISDNWIPLGSLNQGQTIDYNTNPTDMIKKTSIKDDTPINRTIIGHLDYSYKISEISITEETGFDEISHNVIANPKDQTTIEILRGPCNLRNEYSYNPALQSYPFRTPAGMCSSKIPSSDSSGNLTYDNDNDACLVVRYYRTASDTLINNGAYPNPNADLYWGQRTNYNDLGSQCSNKNSTSFLEGTMRSKYVNTKVNMDIDIPNGYYINGTENAYTDYTDAFIGTINKSTISLLDKKYRYNVGISSSSENVNSVNSNTFQNVMKNGNFDSANNLSLNNALVELRIPLRSSTKGNSIEDNMKAKVDNSYISFDRKLWSQFDSPSSCQLYCASWGMFGCTSRRRRVINDGNSLERTSDPKGALSFNQTGLSFAPAEPDEIPVCISSDGKWLQVLNGGMYINDLSNLEDIEHQINPMNPASYNTNWFYNQNNNAPTPGGFMKYGGTLNELLNMDTQFTTDKCYSIEEETKDYDYNSYTYPVAPHYTCSDGKIPWFYSIIKGDYGYLYKFTKQQLKDISSSTIDISKDYDSSVKIEDRVWLYERNEYNEDLVIGKDNIDEVKIIGKGGIFITNDINNLQDKDVTLNINSNVIYDNNQITTGNKIGDYTGDALAIVVNGNLKINSKVTKLEGLYFVDGDVYIEESNKPVEIDRLYVTGNIYVKRNADINSDIDDYTEVQDKPVFRVKGSTRYLYIQPKIIQDLDKYYKETEVPANNLNLDCIENGLCQ